MVSIGDILLRQKRELTETLNKKYIKREIDLLELNKPIIKVITGPRRAGKSFFSIHELSNFGYVNFDDEDILEITNYDEILVALRDLYNDPTVLFLDEIQNLPKWELFVNRLQRQGYNLVISGSNANLLSRELATHLTGRYINMIIFPFSFNEYLSYFRNKFTSVEKKSKLIEYLRNGGYPEPLVKDLNYKDYLKTLFDSILFKDIVKRYNPKYSKGLEGIANFLISNFSNLVSYGNVTKFTDIGSVHTVKKYIGYLEEAFLVFELKRFSFKVKEQEKANKKVYIIDNGLINAKSFNFSKNIGRLYENLVAIELKKRELMGKQEFYYYKKDYEVDFVIKKGRNIEQLIQVCYNIDDIKVKEREIRGLLHASEDLKCKNLLLITEDYEEKEELKWYGIKGKVKYIPLWKWLLYH
jgi:hypothetical protein